MSEEPNNRPCPFCDCGPPTSCRVIIGDTALEFPADTDPLEAIRKTVESAAKCEFARWESGGDCSLTELP